MNAGEIVGLAGLVGAGRTELLEAIFGARHSTAGEIVVRGRQVKRNAPAAAIAQGMAMVPEDRKISGRGAVDERARQRLAAPAVVASASPAGCAARRATRAVTDAMNSVRLRSSGMSQLVGTLSGGNQQKVVLARWLTGEVNVLLLDEPTRGVDVGARSEIYRIIAEFAAAGMAVVMASSDMPEIIGLSHRAFVMRNGAFVGRLDRDALDHPEVQESVFRMADFTPSEPSKATRASDKRPHPSQKTARVIGGSIVTVQTKTDDAAAVARTAGRRVAHHRRSPPRCSPRRGSPVSPCVTRWSSSSCWSSHTSVTAVRDSARPTTW